MTECTKVHTRAWVEKQREINMGGKENGKHVDKTIDLSAAALSSAHSDSYAKT